MVVTACVSCDDSLVICDGGEKKYAARLFWSFAFTFIPPHICTQVDGRLPRILEDYAGLDSSNAELARLLVKVSVCR